MWVAKQRILCSLNQSLKDVLNYGLFQPASDGRDGKFLDEERLLREYPQPTGKGIPSLEVLPPAQSRHDGAGWGGAFPDSGFDSCLEITLKSIVCIRELTGDSVLVCRPGGARGKEPACQCRRHKRLGFDPWVGKIPWRRACNPLQCSCLVNPMDRGAWWATVHGVAKSRTRLKRLSRRTCSA